jgi:hypothetical protein
VIGGRGTSVGDVMGILVVVVVVVVVWKIA